MTTDETLTAANADLRAAVEARRTETPAPEPAIPVDWILQGEAELKARREAAVRTRVFNSDGSECQPRQARDRDPYSEWIPPSMRREEAIAGFKRVVEDARPAREARAARLAKPRLIGIAGRAGAGKNTVADMIPGSGVFGFADPLYEMLAAMLRVSVDSLRDRNAKELPIEWLGRSPRHLLQTLGTEWGREHVAQDVWMRLAAKRADDMVAAGVRVVVVADVRFPDEAAWIRGRGGEVWHLRRPGTDAPSTHVTEAGVAVVGDEPVIVNDGTIEELRSKVERALSREEKPVSRPVVYIASPYTRGDSAINTHFQCRLFNELMNDGRVWPVVPLWSHFQHAMFPRPYQDWIEYDLALLERYDICLRVNAEIPEIGYCQSESSGADGEVAAFLRVGKPVFYDVPSLYRYLDAAEGR